MTLLALAVGAAAAAGFVLDVLPLDRLDAPVPVPWLVLAVAFAVNEVFVVHLQIRRHAHSFYLFEIPLVLGLFFASPTELVLAAVIGPGVALLLQRQSTVKLVTNLAFYAFEASLAVVVFRSILGDAVARHPRAWVAALAAAVAVDVFSTVAITVAMSLHEGALQRERVGQILLFGLVSTLATTSLALVAVELMWDQPLAVVLVGVVAVVVYLAYRSYGSLSQRYANLEQLYDFTRAMSGSLGVGRVAASILAQARDTMRSEAAEVFLFDGLDARTGTRLTLGPGHPSEERVELGSDAVERRVAEQGAPLLLPRGDRALAALPGRRHRDLMAVPLRRAERVIGTLVVADRLGDVTTFDADDLRLFETIANHASVSLENGRLVDRLRQEATEKEHQASHDALTGLPNRQRFRAAVEEAIAGSDGRDSHVAVLLLDLDRFKEVNDTLGHHNGDLLLKEMGARLAAAVGDAGVVARLGGDEFAMCLPGISGTDDVVVRAQALAAVIEEPFSLRDVRLQTTASIGIALHSEHGHEADVLLQRADVAMYAAKQGHSRYQIYETERDPYSPRRLALVAELRRAIDHDELSLHFQPKVDLDRGEVTAAEALLRWQHPRHGPLRPDEFIPLAEHTGLMRPLTAWVLRHALAQCRTWRQAGLDIGVAVNLSARSIDDDLARTVADLLAEHDVRPQLLTLEVTETSIMEDPGRTVAVLHQLSTLGVVLAIDDFGTGHSSLSYLKELPVDELKIDKSFVMHMGFDENDEMIVRSTVDLGHNLGLRVVAEGVENEATCDRLGEIGCDEVQGYYLSRPMPARQFEQWLASGTGIPTRRGALQPAAEPVPLARWRSRA